MAVSISSRLESFYNTFNGKIDGLISHNSDLGNSLHTIKNGYVNVASDVRSAWTDNNSQTTINNLNLISNAVSRLEESSNGDLAPFLTEIKNVVDDIDEIKEKIDSIEKNENSKSTNNKNKDQELLDQNGEIRVLIKNAEGKLDALKNGLNDVSLGIKGNMVTGGSLGTRTAFSYSFTPEKYDMDKESDNNVNNKTISTTTQKTEPNFWGAVGAFMLGGVESVLKIGEGIIDAGATIASVVTGGNEDIKNFIKKEHVSDLFDNIDFMREHKVARNVGNVLGGIGIFAATSGLAATGSLIGSLVSSAYAFSNAGLTSEYVLNNISDNIYVATGAGIVSGVITKMTVKQSADGIKKIFSPKEASNVSSKLDNTKLLPKGSGIIEGVKGYKVSATLPDGKTITSNVKKTLKDGKMILENNYIIDSLGKVVGKIVNNSVVSI